MSNASRASGVKPPVGFTRLRSNLYPETATAGRVLKTTTAYDVSPQVCSCESPAEGGVGCASNCTNRDCYFECHQVFCNCGKACQNQRIRQGQHAKTLVFDAGHKGQGLKAAEDIVAGSLVIEYVGEVISADEAEARCGRYEEQGIKHMYFLQTRSGALIDATMKGNKARFINHSCEPNCQAEHWTVEGRERVGIFATSFISKGHEITYDYHAICAGAPVIRCLCGSSACRGYLDSPNSKAANSSRRHFSAIVGEDVPARSRGNASRPSHDQPCESTETAVSSRKRNQSSGSFTGQQSAKRSRAVNSHRHKPKSAHSASLHRLSSSSDHGHMGTSAKPTAAYNVAPGKAAKALKSFHPVHWGSTSARAQVAQGQRTVNRSHAWGISLFPNAGNIPYSNKAFDATVLSSEGAAHAVSKEVCAKAPERALAAQAVGLESSTQPHSPTPKQAPTPSAAPGPSNGVAKTGNAPQQTSSEPGHRRHVKSGAEPLQMGTRSASQQGCAPRFNQGFWQELQRVLSQLPDHRVAASQPPAAALQLQEAIADAADVQIPLTKCHALACLATASFYRGSYDTTASSDGQSPQQVAQQPAQQAAQQAAQHAAQQADWQAAQQAARQAAQQAAQHLPEHMPQEAARHARVDTRQQRLNAESALPEQAHAHMSMHAMLANGRAAPHSPAGKLAPGTLNTVPTSGMNGQNILSIAEPGPHSDTAVHPRPDWQLLATGPLRLPAQGGGTQITAAQSLQAQQQEGHCGNHTAVPSMSLAGSPGALQQAIAIGHIEGVMPLHTSVAMGKPDAALGRSQQAAGGMVLDATILPVAAPGRASTAGPAAALHKAAETPGQPVAQPSSTLSHQSIDAEPVRALRLQQLARHGPAGTAGPDEQASDCMLPPQLQPSSKLAGLGHKAANVMPPPPPRPVPHMLVNGPGQHSDGLMQSSDSDTDVDVDIDDTSSSQDATAAWIEKQRQCPEPFLTAPELLLTKRLHAPGGLSAVCGPASHAEAFMAIKPAAAQALVSRSSLGAQSSAPVGSPATLVSPLLPGSTRQADAQLRLPMLSAGQQATCSSADLGVDLGPGLKGSRYGHKPPLYPAKRPHGEDTDVRQQSEPRQQAELRMSLSAGAQSSPAGSPAMMTAKILPAGGTEQGCAAPEGATAAVDMAMPQKNSIAVQGVALGAAEQALACRPEQSANTEAHGQAGTRWEQAAPDQQLQMPPVKRQLLLPPTLLPPASVPSDCSPLADSSRPAKGAAEAGDMAADPFIAAQQSVHQGLSHLGLDTVTTIAQHTAERDCSVAFPVPRGSDTQDAPAPAVSTDMHTTAVPAAVLAGTGNGFKWRFQPGTSKLLVEIDTSLIHHSTEMDAAFTHVAQAVKGLLSMPSGRGPGMPATGSAARWITRLPHAPATQAASSEEATYISSRCTSVKAAVQPQQSARPQQAQTCQSPWEQLCVQQSGRPAQAYSASFDKPPVSDKASHVPVGQHLRLAGQTAGSVEALHAPMNLCKGTAPIRLPPLPLKITPRGPTQNLKYWKTVPHGLPEATEKRL